jgi:hypothetical protein
MSIDDLDALSCALFLIAGFALAGVCHSAWLAMPGSQQFAVPLDRGRTLRGRRLLGDNKTLRGFMVMVPATGVAFALLASVLRILPVGLKGLWPLSPVGYALLGCWAAMGFMAGELPNSFIKRQLDIPPGAAALGRLQGPLFFVVDRVDSIFGVMLALIVAVPVPWRTWLFVALIGPALHGLFSVALFRLGVKARPA